jgi:NADPH:quinone reductase-like Zn-dependent oxidoreductase
MRALQFSEYGPAGVLRIAEAPEPHAGPGHVRIAVRASGVTPADWYLRSGRFRDWLPLTFPHVLGADAAGVVDEVGAGVTGVRPGDAVFGVVDVARLGGGNAEHAVLTGWAAKPEALSWEQAGGAAANVETATRVLDRLGAGPGTTLLIEGAAGGVGSAAVQLAVARGATVIGTASARVVTVADLNAAAYGVHLSSSGGPGADPQALHGLAAAAALAEQGRFIVPLAAAFPLEDAVAAHELSETGHARGKIVLTL